jgi:malate dehydrogenase (oxaloacetate-decarboxylating)(NADP+)
MLASGDGDALVSGMTRGYHTTLSEINQVIDVKNHSTSLGIAILISHSRNIFIADAAINENPSAKELADIACQAAEVVAAIGYKPRVALISFSNFGNMQSTNLEKMQDALKELQLRNVNFEFEGEMSPEVALNENLLKLYPFARLSGPANILVMPDLASASIASKLIDEMGGGILVGPILCGLEKPVQIVHMGSSVSDIINSAAFAAAQN